MISFKKFKYILIAFLICIFSYNNVQATNIKYNPTSKFFINDYANLLSDNTENIVYNTSIEIQNKTSAQLVVVTVPNMNGIDIESYANNLFNKFKIGNNEKNNGVLLIIAESERKIRIEVGYGLEGAINDAKAGRILDDYAIPYLKDNNYDAAVINTVSQLKGIIYNEYGIEGGFDNYSNITDDNYYQEPQTAEIIIFIISIIFILILFRIFGFRIFLFGSSGRGFGSGRSSGGGFSGGGGSSGGGRSVKRFLNILRE